MGKGLIKVCFFLNLVVQETGRASWDAAEAQFSSMVGRLNMVDTPCSEH
jgi:hypothetical protein